MWGGVKNCHLRVFLGEGGVVGGGGGAGVVGGGRGEGKKNTCVTLVFCLK